MILADRIPRKRKKSISRDPAKKFGISSTYIFEFVLKTSQN